MGFTQRLKKDKKFRFKVILIFIVAVIILGNTSEKKESIPSQSTCDQFDNLVTAQINGCTNAGCAVVAPNIWSTISVVECLDIYLGGLGLSCTNNPTTSSISTFIAGSQSEASALCGSTKKAIDSGESFCFKTLYTCVDVPTESQCTENYQTQLAGFIDSIWEENKLDCKMKFYITSFGGGFLALMMFMAVI